MSGSAPPGPGKRRGRKKAEDKCGEKREVGRERIEGMRGGERGGRERESLARERHKLVDSIH